MHACELAHPHTHAQTHPHTQARIQLVHTLTHDACTQDHTHAGHTQAHTYAHTHARSQRTRSSACSAARARYLEERSEGAGRQERARSAASPAVSSKYLQGTGGWAEVWTTRAKRARGRIERMRVGSSCRNKRYCSRSQPWVGWPRPARYAMPPSLSYVGLALGLSRPTSGTTQYSACSHPACGSAPGCLRRFGSPMASVWPRGSRDRDAPPVDGRHLRAACAARGGRRLAAPVPRHLLEEQALALAAAQHHLHRAQQLQQRGAEGKRGERGGRGVEGDTTCG